MGNRQRTIYAVLCTVTVGMVSTLSEVKASVYTTPPVSAVPSPMGTLPPPAFVPGKEISMHTPNVLGTGGDRDALGAADPEQTIAWDGTGGTADGHDYTGSRTLPTGALDGDREVDAISNRNDALFSAVTSEMSHLLLSVDDDPNIYYESYGPGPGRGLWASGLLVDDMTPVADVDGLELWGPNHDVADDANHYSLESDGPLGTPDPLGVAVWEFAGGVSSPIWMAADLAKAIAPLAPAAADPDVILDLLETQFNLDGMMTFQGSPGDVSDDQILFTIDPVFDDQGAVIFDGGEIFVYRRDAGSATFLSHGGHLWDTAFAVAQTYGLNSENINALEAVSAAGGMDLPEPCSLIVWLIGAAAATAFCRKRCSARK